MLSIKNLTVVYGQAQGAPYTAIRGLSLKIPTGTVCAVLGPSGGGKSTLVKAVAGLLPIKGAVLWQGAPLDRKKLTIGFMPQNYGLLPWRTAWENALIGPKIRGQDQKAAQARARELFGELGLSGLENRFPRELSGGQQQRVALLRAFLLRPDLLLMDEPFSALDAITREEMQEVFLALWQKKAVTTLLVTHYIEEALYLGSHIALLAAGGRLAEVWENPLFGAAGARESADFAAFAQDLRRKIREMRGDRNNHEA